MRLLLFWSLLLLTSCQAANKRKLKKGGNKAAKKKKLPVSHRSPAQCKNHSGEDVDWWFILEESGPTKRYLYFDSQMAHLTDLTGVPPKFMPLDDRYHLDDPETSPLLKTLYMSQHRSNLTNVLDNTVMIAVNDQRGAEGDDLGKIEKLLQKIAKQSKDPNAELIKIDKGKDIFGHSITSSNAHAKYIFTSQVVPDEKDEKSVKVRSYLISHSLPRFPNFTTRPDGTMILPVVQRNVFNKNALTALSKGQHFFCQSFENDEELDSDDELEYKANEVHSYVNGNRHLISIYHLFKTINAGVVFSNYYNTMADASMKVYRKLFDPRVEWSPEREFSDLVLDDSRLFPIGPVNKKLRTVNCKKCNVKMTCPVQCISSYELKTTNYQYGLSFNAVAHDGRAKVDIYDDIIAPQVLPKAFYLQAQVGQEVKYLMDTLIVQSWMDHTTLANNMRELIKKEDNLAVQAKVWITNSLSLRYPIHAGSQVDDEAYLRQQSFGTNHSKLAFSVPLHGVGERTALFCFADKNRTLTQRGRTDDSAGRGGAAWCTYSGVLSALMLSLHPEVVDNQVEDNMPVWRMIPLMSRSEPERISILQYDKSKTRVDIATPSRSHEHAYHVSSLRHPFVNMVELGRRYQPIGYYYALDVHESDASSDSEFSGSDLDSASSSDRDVVIFDPTAPVVERPLKRNRSCTASADRAESAKRKAFASFGSPSKVEGTPTKFKLPVQVNTASQAKLTGFPSPEHYRPLAELQLSELPMCDDLLNALAKRISPENMRKIYKIATRDPPKFGRVRRKINL